MAAVSPRLGGIKLESEVGISGGSDSAITSSGLGSGSNGPRPSLGNGTGNGNGNGADSSSLDRPASPVKPSLGGAGATSTGGPESRPPVTAPKHDRPIDMRAEEDAARRLNVGRVVGNSRYAGSEARGRKTDLCGPEFRMSMQRRARNHQMTIDDEALAYLSMAAETQLRQLLSSSVSAQQHRTTSSYLHPPPLQPASSSSSNRSKAMWDVSIQSDPNAVLDALNRQAKEAEREFRTSRMNRLAKEHEMERIRERQAALSGAGGPAAAAVAAASTSVPAPTSGDINGQPSTPSTPQAELNGDHDAASSPGAHPPSSPDKGGAPSPSAGPASTSTSTPTFGGAKKFTKGKKNPKDVSADVQIKMSNATAMRSAGMGKKYSWMSSAPSISSPLSGNKKKGKKGSSNLATGSGAGATDDAGIEGEEDQQQQEGDQPAKKRKKLHSNSNSNAHADDASSTTRGEKSKSKRRRMPTMPSRRMVLVGSDAKGEDKFSPDDKCLTVNDLVFALDREKGGQGMGTSDEVVRRVMARPGGPWGMASGRRL